MQQGLKYPVIHSFSLLAVNMQQMDAVRWMSTQLVVLSAVTPHKRRSENYGLKIAENFVGKFADFNGASL